jgi:hypothetical protein
MVGGLAVAAVLPAPAQQAPAPNKLPAVLPAIAQQAPAPNKLPAVLPVKAEEISVPSKLPATLPVKAQGEPATEKLPAPLSARVLTLGDCLAIASQRQPALAAYRASLAAARTGQKALDETSSIAIIIAPDLPVRRKQACIGVEIAYAQLNQAELDIAYAVTRLYYTIVYAREQQKVADDLSSQFKFYRDEVSAAIKKPKAPKEWTDTTVYKLSVYHGLAQSRLEEAKQGELRALAALREALGLCDKIDVADSTLPQPEVDVGLCDVVNMARTMRGEAIQANKAVEVFSLEIDAQGRHMCPGKVDTFAAGADIHANPVPQGSTGAEYKPAAVGPEMPVKLVGSRTLRMERAKDFSGRASAVAEKTENLVALEAEDTYHRWREAKDKVTTLRDAEDAGRKLAENTRKDFRGQQAVKIDDVLTSEVVAGQARSTYNEALLNQAIALSALERVTGGGFHAGLVAPVMKAK